MAKLSKGQKETLINLIQLDNLRAVHMLIEKLMSGQFSPQKNLNEGEGEDEVEDESIQNIIEFPCKKARGF